MLTALPRSLSDVRSFLRNRSLARTVVLLLTGAIVLLLAVNLSTFVLIERTAAFNTRVDQAWQARRAGRLLLLNLRDAEAAQRGYILTGQASFLLEYRGAVAANRELLDGLEARLEGDPVGAATIEAVTRLSRDKIMEMNRVVDLIRAGRRQDGIDLVSSGRGAQLMLSLGDELNGLDQRLGVELAEGRSDSEASAVLTVAINAIAGGLIVVLGIITFVLIRRYFAELSEARAEVDRVNLGLEETIRARTAALTRANEEIQRFAYIVSHDLRSPLVNVMGYTAELEQVGKTMDRAISEAEKTRALDPEVISAVRDDLPEAVGFIRASTEKMDRLINAILKLSREGRRTLAAESIDVGVMSSRIADSMRHQTEAAGASIVVGDTATFESDRLSIEQIMGNLIDNAVKYLDPARAGLIRVDGRDLPGGWVEVTVSDNGRGISEKDHERIFELFRRSGRQDRPGEGLGLAFVRNSVRRLGGSIEVDSRLGEGSTFRLKFPKRLILEAGDTL